MFRLFRESPVYIFSSHLVFYGRYLFLLGVPSSRDEWHRAFRFSAVEYLWRSLGSPVVHLCGTDTWTVVSERDYRSVLVSRSARCGEARVNRCGPRNVKNRTRSVRSARCRAYARQWAVGFRELGFWIRVCSRSKVPNEFARFAVGVSSGRKFALEWPVPQFCAIFGFE